MKIAVAFKGVHYMNGSHNWYIDFEKQVPNFKNCILHDLQSKGHDVDIFLSTYEYSSEKTELLKTLYSPARLNFIPYIENEERFSSQYRHYFNIFEIINEYQMQNCINYDLIIITRYDIEMNNPFSFYNYDYSTFNICFKQPGGDVDDCFWVFPAADLTSVYLTLHKMANDKVTLHKFEKYYPHAVKFLMSVEDYTIKPVYNLKRTVRDNIWQY